MRKKTVLLALVILALGLVGTGLSTLYQQSNWYIPEPYDPKSIGPPNSAIKVSYYGFPLSWYGYSQNWTYSFSDWGLHFLPPPKIYWFSLGSLLLDAVFWVAISFLVCTATMKSVNKLRKTKASKILSVINI